MSENSAEQFYNKAIAYYNDGIFGLAIQNFQKTIEIDPTSFEAHYNLGMCFFNKKDYDAAFNSFTKASELNPEEDSSFSNIALIYLKKKDYNSAIKYYEKALEINPDNYGVYKDIGDVHLKDQDYDKAIEWYNKSLEKNSCFIAAKKALEWAEDQKKTKEKEIAIQKAKSQPPKVPTEDGKTAQEHFEIGVNFVKINYLDQALNSFKKCYKLNPNNTKAREFIDKLIKIKQNQSK